MYNHKNGIILKKLEISHLSELKNLKDESWPGTHSIAILNSSDQSKWFNSLDNNKQIVLTAFEGDTLVGIYKISNIDWMNRKYDSAHDIFKYKRGKGYGKKVLEAGVDFGFEILNMHRLDTEILVNNAASIKTAEYAGFKKEGTKKKAIYKCGEYISSFVYGLIYDDWRSLPRVKGMGNVCNKSYISLKDLENQKVVDITPENVK